MISYEVNKNYNLSTKPSIEFNGFRKVEIEPDVDSVLGLDLAICITVKNRSNVRVSPWVDSNDLDATFSEQADSIVDIHPQETSLKVSPKLNVDGTISLELLPRLLMSLRNIKKPWDNWTVIIVDFDSSDANVTALAFSILNGHIDFTIHTIKDSHFSRGTGLHTAAVIAKSRGHYALFFCDADMLLTRRDIFDRAHEVLIEEKVFFPVSFSLTNPEHTKGFWREYGYGMLFITTEMYFNVDGWVSQQEWGDEDIAMRDNFLSPVIVRESVAGYFHQWHPNDWNFKNKEYVNWQKPVTKAQELISMS